MQDQTDPSMEEALAAIKRVMAEDKGQRAAARAAAPPPEAAKHDGGDAGSGSEAVLELDQPIIEDIGLPMVDLSAPMIDIPFEAPMGEPLVSDVTAETTRAKLAELQEAASAPPPPATAEPGDMNPFEQMVRDMLRPMLKSWLDEHLPRVIEEQVKREIGRITGQRL